MGGRIYRNESNESIIELPEVGRLKIGMKNEKGYPMSIDWFRATGKYADAFNAVMGEKPNLVQIVFPDDNAEKVCNEQYEYRDNAGALVARGDGQTFEVWNGKKYVKMQVSEYPRLMEQVVEKYPTKKVIDNWDITLTMQFIIPKVRGIVGVWRLVTKGQASSIKNIRNSFDSVQMMRGTVTQTVFDLSVQYAKSNKPGVSSRYPVLALVANDTRIAEIKQALNPTQNLSLLMPG